MKIDRLFQVLVVTGASSTVGIVGCGSDNSGGSSTGTGGETATGGATASGGETATGGATASGGAAAGGAAGSSCDAVCHPSATLATWTDCNGCCCWLPIGTPAPVGSPTCGQEPCCVGRGR
ncbi:MAG TPA: hypothetical protein VH142_24765 [Polyangiaceae bacterium]|nr:hypothetical protein [Polyangiaceae bacterium]